MTFTTAVNIGSAVDLRIGDVRFSILRTGPRRYVVRRMTSDGSVDVGETRSYVAANDMATKAADEVSVFYVSESAYKNATFMASHADSETARRFWARRLDRMRVHA
jgi:hypothetical protein